MGTLARNIIRVIKYIDKDHVPGSLKGTQDHNKDEAMTSVCVHFFNHLTIQTYEVQPFRFGALGQNLSLNRVF